MLKKFLVLSTLSTILIGIGISACQTPEYAAQQQATQQIYSHDFQVYPAGNRINLARVVDTKAGVVCYVSTNSIYCLPIKDTNLR